MQLELEVLKPIIHTAIQLESIKAQVRKLQRLLSGYSQVLIKIVDDDNLIVVDYASGGGSLHFLYLIKDEQCFLHFLKEGDRGFVNW